MLRVRNNTAKWSYTFDTLFRSVGHIVARIQTMFLDQETDADDYITIELENGDILKFTTMDHLINDLYCMRCTAHSCDCAALRDREGACETLR